MDTDLTPTPRAPVDIQPADGQDSTDGFTLDPRAVAVDWVDRALADFALIARTKETFYRDIYEDGRWRDCYSFADLSRRYSSLIRLIFVGVQKQQPSLQPPSQTELHAWFTLFTQRDQLSAANVPERLLPPNRGVAAALASATAKVPDPVDKRERQKAILLKLEQESEIAVANGCKPLPFTAATVREIAGAMGMRKPKVTRPLIYRELDELDAEAWAAVVGGVQELRSVVLSQLTPEQEHTKCLTLARRLEALCLRPSRFVFGVFDSRECFTAPLIENFVGKLTPIEPGAKHAKRHTGFVTRNGAGACWSSVGYDTVPSGSGPHLPPGSDLPEIAVGLEGRTDPKACSRVVLATDEKAADKVVDSAIAALQVTVVPIPLAIWQDWEGRGGIPIGTYVDEVLEPTTDDDVDDSDDDADDLIDGDDD